MSGAIESRLPPGLREAMLEEIKAELPAFLSSRASVQSDPVGDVSELLGLDPPDLRKVIRTHQCLDSAALDFGEALRAGLRRALVASTRLAEPSGTIKGPIDWPATISSRAREPVGSTFMIRPGRKQLDIPENRAIAWLVDSLTRAAKTALGDKGPSTEAGLDPERWKDRVKLLAFQLREARGSAVLAGLSPGRPTPATMQRLEAARSRFYAVELVAALRSAMRLETESPEAITDALCARYFEPGPSWLVFEICIALRLARAFRGAVPGGKRRSRLLVGSGKRAPYASFAWPDGSEVHLSFQGWPESVASSQLREVSERHRMKSPGSVPDLVVERSGAQPDGVVLELKASSRDSYLGKGLAELLSYVADRGSDWVRPAGWLVAPPSPAFREAAPDPGSEVWIVASDRVAKAALARFVPRSP